MVPENGFEDKWVIRSDRKIGQSVQISMKEERNFFFRIRSVVRESKIIGGLYGKIQGDIYFYPGTTEVNPDDSLQFIYYLNPVFNDRNVEFDPKQNLFKDLKPLERVTAP